VYVLYQPAARMAPEPPPEEAVQTLMVRDYIGAAVVGWMTIILIILSDPTTTPRSWCG
jgi:hypothetical protein